MSEKKIEKQKKSFDIRNYKPGDELAICALFERVFGKPMGKTESLRHWQWEFLKNPVDGLFIKLAWDGDKLVGQYTASPVQMYANGSNFTAALSHDTMTAPQYGGLGIFRATAEALYTEQKKAGHGFIYGFPNRNSIHGFEKYLNWRRVMSAPVHVRPLNFTKYIFNKLAGRKNYQVPEKNIAMCMKKTFSETKSGEYRLTIEPEFNDWADDLWMRCQNQHYLWVIRDKTYLNWRYVERPESNYIIITIWLEKKTVGYAVIDLVEKEFGSTLFVLDYMVDLNFKKAGETLIKYIVKIACNSGALFASVLLSPGSKYRNLFRRHLFMPLPERLFPQQLYFGARCFDHSFIKLIFDPKAWSISWGDNDVI